MVKVVPVSSDVNETFTSFASGTASLSNHALGLGWRAARSIPDVSVMCGTNVGISEVDAVARVDGIVFVISSVSVSWIL